MLPLPFNQLFFRYVATFAGIKRQSNFSADSHVLLVFGNLWAIRHWRTMYIFACWWLWMIVCDCMCNFRWDLCICCGEGFIFNWLFAHLSLYVRAGVIYCTSDEKDWCSLRMNYVCYNKDEALCVSVQGVFLLRTFTYHFPNVLFFFDHVFTFLTILEFK